MVVTMGYFHSKFFFLNLPAGRWIDIFCGLFNMVPSPRKLLEAYIENCESKKSNNWNSNEQQCSFLNNSTSSLRPNWYQCPYLGSLSSDVAYIDRFLTCNIIVIVFWYILYSVIESKCQYIINHTLKEISWCLENIKAVRVGTTRLVHIFLMKNLRPGVIFVFCEPTAFEITRINFIFSKITIHPSPQCISEINIV